MKAKSVGVLLVVLWYCAAAAAALIYCVRVLLPARDALDAQDVASILAFAGVVIGLIAIVAAFFLGHFVARLWWKSGAGGLPEAGGGRTSAAAAVAFPAPITLLVGGSLLLFGIANAAGFALAWLLPQTDNRTLLLTVLAAGLGSCVATMLGYLLHASENKDFDASYAAWYVGRPFIGLILGLIFYFLIKGGLLMVATDSANLELGDAAMAAIGSLVGLFSKNAVEKLREVFNTLFQTKAGMSTEILASLPPDLREKVAPYLKPASTPSQAGKRPGGTR